MANFQRVGEKSNASVGSAFETKAFHYFVSEGLKLELHYKLDVGVSTQKKAHAFDLGSAEDKIIVECKSHKWTAGNNVPSAKLTVWNEAMYYFHIAPSDYRKVFFILHDYSGKRKETLGEYYIRTYGHLIPDDVEIMEFNEETNTVYMLKK